MPEIDASNAEMYRLRGVQSKRQLIKLEKTLAKLHLSETVLKEILEMGKVALANPAGVFLFGSLLIDGLERLGYFGSIKSQTPSSGGASIGLLNSVLSDISRLFGSQSPLGLASNGLQGMINGGSANTVSSGTINASLLETGLFSICMAQALGGGSGISSIATSAIAALK